MQMQMSLVETYNIKLQTETFDAFLFLAGHPCMYSA